MCCRTRSDLAPAAVHAARTRVRGAYMAFTHDRNFPIATTGRRVMTANASSRWKSGKRPGNDDGPTSVLRYDRRGRSPAVFTGKQWNVDAEAIRMDVLSTTDRSRPHRRAPDDIKYRLLRLGHGMSRAADTSPGLRFYA